MNDFTPEEQAILERLYDLCPYSGTWAQLQKALALSGSQEMGYLLLLFTAGKLINVIRTNEESPYVYYVTRL